MFNASVIFIGACVGAPVFISTIGGKIHSKQARKMFNKIDKCKTMLWYGKFNWNISINVNDIIIQETELQRFNTNIAMMNHAMKLIIII